MDSFVFYRSFYEAIRHLDYETIGKIIEALSRYALDDEEPPSDTDPTVRVVFMMAKPQIDVNKKRFENGKKGGRPKCNQTGLQYTEVEPKDNQSVTKSEPNGNQSVTKSEPNGNQSVTKSEPNGNQSVTKSEPNYNYNLNDNDNDNILVLSGDNTSQPATSKKRSTKKKPEEYTIVTKGRKFFEDYTQSQRGTLYIWGAKEAKAMKELFHKIELARKDKNLPTDDDSLLCGFKSLVETAENMTWLSSSFDIPTLNSQYNKIVAEAKLNRNRNNGINKNEPAKPSAKEEFVSPSFATKRKRG